jgi:hypothetical protein
MATLTVIHGNEQRTFEEHPNEVARKALMAAADVEEPLLAAALRRVALALPHRGPLADRQEGAGDGRD